MKTMTRKYAPATTVITTVALLISMCASLTFSRRTAAQVDVPLTNKEANEYPLLSKYATDLTKLAIAGKLELTHDHDADVARVIASLSSAAKNPVVVGESDLDRDAIARAVAIRIALNEVPDVLRDKRVFRLSIEALAKGARNSDEFSNRVRTVFAEATTSEGRAILFVDQLNQYAGSRATMVASTAVKDALAANHLRIIGGASPEAYATYIASDDSVARLFDSIAIDHDNATGAAAKADKRRSPINEEFEGEKVSADMRELMKSAHNGRVPAILQVSDVNNKEVRALLAQNGVLLSDAMPKLGAMKVDLPVKAVDGLMKSGLMNYISPDRRMESFGHVTATTGADQVRNSPGLLGGLLGASAIDGSGVTIAILDSGVDNGHAAFLNTSILPATRIKFSKDFTSENNATNDPYGHGSHVAASAAGISTASGDAYLGMAPNANIVSLRVLDKNGQGSVSALLSALNWILAAADPTKPVSSSNPLNKDKFGIRVVNMSLGAPAIDTYKNDPVCRAARAVVDAGIVVVAAAGNNGKDANGNKIYGEIHSPGNEPSVITVGAANTFGTESHTDDGVATYSSRGPTRSSYTDASGVKHYDNLIKPDLIAPGNKLIFAESDLGNSGGGGGTPNLLIQQNPQLDSGISDRNNKRLMYLSGTSMATPAVSGAAALLLQLNPKLTPNMVQMALMYTADPLPGWNLLEQGTGELNIEGAARLAKAIRTDINSSTPQDAPMLSGPAPNPQTTIGGQTFTWAQGINLKHWYATGSALETNYQSYYRQGLLLGDGVVLGDDTVLSDGVVLGDSIFTSAGVVLGDGTIFCSGVVLGDTVVLGDGAFLGDGVVLGDAVVLGEGVVLGDAAVQAMSARAMIYGDSGPAMQPTR